MTTITVTTRSRTEMIEITDRVAEEVRASGIQEGTATVFVPHTTAGVTINENADPDVTDDLVAALDRLVPRRGPYRHGEGNSDAHIKSTLVGQAATLPVTGGRMALGTWQGVYFCEFDGPRTRRVLISVH
jgi:secondary thiamine-phosphate synthase enzyme